MEHHFEAPIWRYPGDAGWRFITLPPDIADEIDATAETGGFGSVRVAVRVGATSWETSIFPSKNEASFVLPVKAAVRTAEGISDGDLVRVHLVVKPPRPSPKRSSSARTG
jgi:hypothetical protein